jgi:hypothetical protein
MSASSNAEEGQGMTTLRRSLLYVRGTGRSQGPFGFNKLKRAGYSIRRLSEGHVLGEPAF